MTPERLAAFRKTFGGMSTEDLRAIAEGRKKANLSEESLSAIRLLLEERKRGGVVVKPPIPAQPAADRYGKSTLPQDTSSNSVDPLSGAKVSPPSPPGMKSRVLSILVLGAGLLVFAFGTGKVLNHLPEYRPREAEPRRADTLGPNSDPLGELMRSHRESMQNLQQLMWNVQRKKVRQRYHYVHLLGFVMIFAGTYGMSGRSAPSLAGTEPPPARRSELAIASILLGGLGLLCFGGTAASGLILGMDSAGRVGLDLVLDVGGRAFFSAAPVGGIALILGLVSMRRIKKSGGMLTGSRMAFAGTIISAGCLAFPLAFPRLFSFRAPAQRAACVSNLREIQTAKLLWARETLKGDAEVPTEADLVGPDKFLIRKLTCPAGGRYTFGAVSEAAVCSVPAHNPQAQAEPKPLGDAPEVAEPETETGPLPEVVATNFFAALTQRKLQVAMEWVHPKDRLKSSEKLAKVMESLTNSRTNWMQVQGLHPDFPDTGMRMADLYWLLKQRNEPPFMASLPRPGFDESYRVMIRKENGRWWVTPP